MTKSKPSSLMWSYRSTSPNPRSAKMITCFTPCWTAHQEESGVVPQKEAMGETAIGSAIAVGVDTARLMTSEPTSRGETSGCHPAERGRDMGGSERRDVAGV